MSAAESVAALPSPMEQEQPPLEGEPLTDGDEPPIVIAEATSKCRSWPQTVTSLLARGACCGCLRRRRLSLWPPFSAFGAGLLATPVTRHTLPSSCTQALEFLMCVIAWFVGVTLQA